jgi:hypothetical protein
MIFVTLAKHRVRNVFGNRVLRGIFSSEGHEVTGNGENYIMRSLMICTAQQILFG